MTKASEQRTKNSLERARLRLKARAIELEAAEKALLRETLAIRSERSETVALLQLLCEQHGTTAWDPSAPLTDIIETHLLGPLLARTAQAAAPAAATAAARPEAAAPVMAHAAPPAPPARPPLGRPAQPEPRYLRSVPPVVHRVMVVEAQDRSGLRGHACRCTCGWTSRIAETASEGWRRASEHERDPLARETTAYLPPPHRGVAAR